MNSKALKLKDNKKKIEKRKREESFEKKYEEKKKADSEKEWPIEATTRLNLENISGKVTK